jgi:hypothetical protein
LVSLDGYQYVIIGNDAKSEYNTAIFTKNIEEIKEKLLE